MGIYGDMVDPIINKFILYKSHTHLKGLSHEIDYENVDENLQILALIRSPPKNFKNQPLP
jgi:hypothetical protein